MIDATIRAAVAPLELPIEPNGYNGEELEYLSYTYSELGALFAESTAQAIRYLVDLSWYLPHGKDPGQGKARIRQLLKAAGATWPDIVNASDDEGQHYVFSFEMVGPVPEEE